MNYKKGTGWVFRVFCFCFFLIHMNLSRTTVISETPDVLTLLMKYVILPQPAPEKELLVVWQPGSQSRPWGLGGSVCRAQEGQFFPREMGWGWLGEVSSGQGES